MSVPLAPPLPACGERSTRSCASGEGDSQQHVPWRVPLTRPPSRRSRRSAVDLVWDFRGQAQVCHTLHFPLAPSFRAGGRSSTAGADRPHESGGDGPATNARADKTIRGEPAMTWATIAPQPCIRWMIERGPRASDHDAAMRISGEAPRRRAHSLPRHGSHGRPAGHRHLGSSWRCIAPKRDERRTCLSPPLPLLPVGS